MGLCGNCSFLLLVIKYHLLASWLGYHPQMSISPALCSLLLLLTHVCRGSSTHLSDASVPLTVHSWWPVLCLALRWNTMHWWVFWPQIHPSTAIPSPSASLVPSLNLPEQTRYSHLNEHSVQFSSVAQSCLTLCDPMDSSMPGFLVHHQLPELAQTHVHQVSDAIQPSHPLSSPSPPAFNLSRYQGLF